MYVLALHSSEDSNMMEITFIDLLIFACWVAMFYAYYYFIPLLWKGLAPSYPTLLHMTNCAKFASALVAIEITHAYLLRLQT
jgi:hypothetical protein